MTITRGAEPPIRVGIVGCGAVAELYHLPALSASPDVSVEACVDPAAQRARRLADLAGGQVFTSHREIIGLVDLALVTVPNSLHETVAVDLLDAGVHVLVEKPMARTTAECDRMIAAAQRSGKVLAVGHDFRYFPVAQFARALFESQMLGTIRSVGVKQSAGTRWPAASPELLSPAAGGGVLINFGVHILDLLGWWFGELRVVSYRDDAVGGVEAECDADLELRTGAPLKFELSFLRTMRDTCVVHAERGSVEIGIHDPAVIRLTTGTDLPLLTGGVSDAEFERAPMRIVFARQLADVVRAIRGTGELTVSAAEARQAVALVEACYAAREPLRRPWDYPECYSAGAARAD